MRTLLAFLLGLSPIFSMANQDQFLFPQGKVQLYTGTNSFLLSFSLSPEWHIYWQNPGDSGAAPKFQWESPEVNILLAGWPTPKRYSAGGLTNIGYSKKVDFLFLATPEPNQNKKSDQTQNLIAKLKLEFLVCKVECIPYFAQLKAPLKIAPREPSTWTAEANLNLPQPNSFGVQLVKVSQDLGTIQAHLNLPESLRSNLKNLHIYPVDGLTFKPQAPKIEIRDQGFQVELPLQANAKIENQEFQFLVAIEDHQGQSTSFQIPLQSRAQNFLVILLSAILGGILLNIMPCVFPVLSIKILSFMGPEKSRSVLMRSGWLYTLGVVFSFLLIGSFLLLLRAQGEQIGWGFQLQSPVVASSIALLFFWLSLNFLGFFEIGQSLSRLDRLGTTQSKWSAFLTGVLATLVATPCTAPFMGTALGASLTLPPQMTLLIFLALGLGMALPFLLLAHSPGLLSFLPRPGGWMNTFKEFLAFPLLLTVIWLFWVVAQQTGSETLVYLMLVLVLIGFSIWLAGKVKSDRKRQIYLTGFFLLSLAAPVFLVSKTEQSTAAVQTDWPAFSEESVQSSLKSGRSVFIDFTAAWCITCQVNKKLVLNTSTIESFFSENKIDRYRADWTDRDPKITQALARFGRNSLPLYVFYKSADHEPVLLPEVLTQKMILDLLNPTQPK